MCQNIVACDLILLLIVSLLGYTATLNRPSSIRPQSTYLPADLVANTNSSYFIQARKINSEEILLNGNITYNGHGLFVDKLVWDVQPHGGAVQASYGPFNVFHSDSLIFNSSELYNLNIQTHIITKHIQPYNPSLNILFHLDYKQLKLLNDLSVCVDLHILYTEGVILSSCLLNKSTGSCFLDIPIPMEWWLEVSDASYQNPKMQLSYSVSKTVTGECGRRDNSLKSRTMSTTEKEDETKQAPSVYLGEIPLQSFAGHYSRVDSDSRIIIKVPDNKDVNPTNGFLIPVSIPQDFNAESFSVRIKPKKGLIVSNIHFHDADIPWHHANTSDEDSTTVFFMLTSAKGLEAFNALPPHEVPIFLVEFKVMNDTSNSRHINWKIDVTQNGNVMSSKLSTKISLTKGDVLALIPIAEKTELVNTAVLNHQPVTSDLKVFAITQEHVVVDVTNQSACTSNDKNIIKVQQDCSFIFLDGSEDESTSDISITATYKGKSVDLSVWVWRPELPLTIELSDQRLSLIKEWKVPHRGLRRYNRSPDNKCRLRYQQATVAVYTRFYTKHANSGRKVYMFGKDIKEDVTSLLSAEQFTTSDLDVATIDNLILYGHSDGIAFVQILQGKGNKALAHKEFIVGGDKVSLTDLHISMVTGLSIHNVRDPDHSRLKAVRVKANDQLIAKYQEGILDVTLGFSDGAILPLRHVSSEDFLIKILSNNRNIVMERSDSTQAGHIVVIGEGATTVDVDVQLPRICHKKHKSTNTILSRIYPVNVSFASENIQQKLRKIGEDEASGNNVAPDFSKPGFVHQNGAVDYGIVHSNFDPSLYETGEPEIADKTEKESDRFNIPLDQITFGNGNEPKKNMVPDNDRNRDFTNNIANDIEDNNKRSSAMEIGMYVMLAVFALAITVFLLNCMVYMYRISRRKKAPPSVIGNYVTPNESWSWLGRDMDPNGVLKREACEYGKEENDVPLTQVYTESEVSIEHHSSCSDSQVDSGSHDISETNLEDEEINVADETSVDEAKTIDGSPEEEPVPLEEDPLLKDVKVMVNPLSKENITEDAMEYDQLLSQLHSLQAEVQP